VVAKKVKELFDGTVHEKIRQTTPELAFQISLLDVNLRRCAKNLANEKVYIRNVKSHAHFAIFSLLVKALQSSGAKFGDPMLAEQLRAQWADWYPTHYGLWKKLTKACIDCIVKTFKMESAKFLKQMENLSIMQTTSRIKAICLNCLRKLWMGKLSVVRARYSRI
jgi:hypothetical protein